MPDCVRFTETMRGYLSTATDVSYSAAADAGRRLGPALFTLHVVTSDVDAMIADPRHRSPVFGCVIAPSLTPEPLRVVDGHLDLFVDTAPNEMEMRYALTLQTSDRRRYVLEGVKNVRRRRWFPTFPVDTTTLFVDVLEDGDPARPVLKGILWMNPVGVLAQAISFRGEGRLWGLMGVARYLRHYFSRVLVAYSGRRRALGTSPDAP